jgi:hypothetical protein
MHLDQLQLLARPGVVAGVLSMLQQLPKDTLQQQLQAAAAEIKAAAHAAGLSSSSSSQQMQQQQQVKIPAELLQAQLSFKMQELLVVVPTELNCAAGLSAVVHLQGLRLSPSPPPVNPGTAGGRSTPAAIAAAGANDIVLQASSTDEDESISQYRSSESGGSSSSSSSRRSGLSSDASTAAGAEAHEATHSVIAVHQQQHYSLELAMVSVGVHRPDAAAAAAPPKSYSQAVTSSIRPQLQELLKLPALQGVVTVTCPPAAASCTPAGVASGKSKASQQQQLQQQPLIKLGLQLPPVSCTVSASLAAALQRFAAALKFQLQLPLAELVVCYHLSLDKQPAAAAAARTQRQEQQQQQQSSTQQQQGGSSASAASDPSAAAAAAASEADLLAVAAVAGVIGSQDDASPPSPTDSEVARWMAAPATLQPAAAAEEDAAQQQFEFDDAPELDHLWNLCHGGSSTGSSGTGAHQQQQQLKRCDSDRLLQSMSLSPPTMLEFPQQQRQQQQREAGASSGQRQRRQQQQRSSSSAAAAAVLALPDLQLLQLDLLLEELDVQYIQDLPITQQQQSNSSSSSSSSPELHLRLQASLLQVHFHLSTHSSTAELSLNDIVLQDVLPVPAAAAAAAAVQDWRRLLSHLLLDRVQLAWCSQLRQLGQQQELQAALIGLQLQVSGVGACGAPGSLVVQGFVC